jgi:hypothetical protein
VGLSLVPPRPHRDKRLPPVLLFQGAQLRRGQQGQSQLSNHGGRHFGYRPFQHRLRTPGLSRGKLGGICPATSFRRSCGPFRLQRPRTPPGPTHRAHARPVSGGLDQLSLVHAELVAAQQGQQRRGRQLQKAAGPQRLLRARVSVSGE